MGKRAVNPFGVAIMAATAVLFMSAVALRWWWTAAANAALFLVNWQITFGRGER